VRVSKGSERAISYGSGEMIPRGMRERLMALAYLLIGFAGGMVWGWYVYRPHVLP
jgi:hypothetical protein